ncbi:catalase family peroxidase [Acetobacter fallax]|uniref:Catalase-related peroxidase n=1 Tax=Acetobacter fallax TaxID=1737473 RepID=A0ABX0K8C7_9PROT|nr:catalase family peroxidase [Acetobacter fallax]NHO32650.1 catalase [Acetobacter fallax]NHO36152.1 catalase [Acetobacter fallax]
MKMLPDDRPGEPGIVFRLAVVGAVPLVLGLAFIGAAGWFSPHRLTQSTLMNTFQAVDGLHPGFRRNHAKGMCVTGWFESSGQAMHLSRATLFGPVRSPVIGRFALAGGMPYQNDAPAKVRSMALRIMPPDGAEWRMGINDIPVFPVRNVSEFNTFTLATRPDPRTGKPDPARMGAFVTTHPETAQAIALIKSRPITSGFANDTYNSLDSFLFVSPNGTTTPVRWAMVPEQARQQSEPRPDETHDGRDYLFTDLIAALARAPLRWHLMITPAEPGDPVADPALPWPSSRPQIDAGVLTLNAAESEDGGPCTNFTYDPLVLPSGITPSDDPIPAARSAAYARSLTLRSGEHKPPGAITPAMIRPGEKT